MMQKRSNAFSLLETLAVVAVGALLLTVATRSLLPSREHLAPREAAREFQSLLREARLLALQHRAPTRVVFIPQSLSSGQNTSGEDPPAECAIFRFVIPASDGHTVAWRSPAAENSLRGGDALERLPMAPPGLPQELVGQWQRVPHKRFRWGETLDRRLEMHSEILDRFSQQSAEEFAQENAFRPLAFWRAGESSPWEGFSQSSPYPPNYYQTPWPESPRLVRKPLPASARVYDEQAERWQAAAIYWPSDVPTPHFCTAELEALTFHDLPYIEFDAQGRLQIFWEGEREVVFAVEGRPEHQARVVLGGADGPIHLAEARRP